MIKKYIKRKYYLEKINPFIDKGIIKVIVGQRRVGKSYLLFQLMDVIKKIIKTLILFISIKSLMNLRTLKIIKIL